MALLQRSRSLARAETNPMKSRPCSFIRASTKPLSCESGDNRGRPRSICRPAGFNEAALLRERRPGIIRLPSFWGIGFNEAALLRERRPRALLWRPSSLTCFNEAALLRERRLFGLFEYVFLTETLQRSRSLARAETELDELTAERLEIASTKPLSCESGDRKERARLFSWRKGFNEAALLRERRLRHHAAALGSIYVLQRSRSLARAETIIAPHRFGSSNELQRSRSLARAETGNSYGQVAEWAGLQRSRSLARAETR